MKNTQSIFTMVLFRKTSKKVIDKMVCELNGLREEDIGIVENS